MLLQGVGHGSGRTGRSINDRIRLSRTQQCLEHCHLITEITSKIAISVFCMYDCSVCRQCCSPVSLGMTKRQTTTNYRKSPQTTANHHKPPEKTQNHHTSPQTTTNHHQNLGHRQWNPRRCRQTTTNHCKPPPEYEKKKSLIVHFFGWTWPKHADMYISIHAVCTIFIFMQAAFFLHRKALARG